MIFPLEGFADTGLSIKVFMPLVYNKLLMLDCKIFCLCKFARLHSDRLTQDDLALHEENRFPVSALYVHVDRGVVVAVEEESESVFREYCRHENVFLRQRQGVATGYRERHSAAGLRVVVKRVISIRGG